MVLVQAPSTADFPDMPASALATGLADEQGAPADLARRLPGLLAPEEPEVGLDRVFELLRERSGHDFSSYKPRTLHRRIERRMALRKISSLVGYLTYLEDTPAEVDLLFQDLLIGVTQFFRDPAAFEVLERNVIPAILARKSPGMPIRVWSAGCSTGEEAYSLAMLFTEKLSEMNLESRIQIFATDLDVRAITAARFGRYPAEIRADVSADRLARFFTLDADGLVYTVQKALRDKIVFSEHDLVRDPPFSRLDLVLCRNVLIYLENDLQARILSLFHYALVPGGTLFLGNAESTGVMTPLFAPVDAPSKLFRRLPEVPAEELPRRRKSTPIRPRLPTVMGTSEVELQAFNEELQSTNEELETTKEELQSLNEELSTVNSELQAKVGDLARANDDMNNLLAGTGIATVFIDRSLRILRYTPAATQVFPLMPGDVGRPLGNLVTRLVGHDRMLTDAQAVLDTLEPVQHEVVSDVGTWFNLRLLPYRTRENLVQGVVISFVDITEIVTKRNALRTANDLLRLAVVVRDSHDAVTVQGLDGKILAWNPGATRIYGWTEDEALAMNVRDRIPVDLRDRAIDQVKRLSQSAVLEPIVTRRLAKNGEVLEVSLVSTALIDEAGAFYAIATTERLGRAP
jgi:two-component system CheB/CheR fusion protein